MLAAMGSTITPAISSPAASKAAGQGALVVVGRDHGVTRLGGGDPGRVGAEGGHPEPAAASRASAWPW